MPSVSTNLISPPNACLIITLFAVVTSAVTFVTPALFIALAITVASVVAPAAVNETFVAVLNVFEFLSVEATVKLYVPAPKVVAVTTLLVILVAPVFAFLNNLNVAKGCVSAATFVIAYTAPAAIPAPPPDLSRS